MCVTIGLAQFCRKKTMRSALFRLAVPACLALWLGGCGTAPTALPPASLGNRQAAADALRLQGQPYRYGGERPGEGFDCSGLVQYVYARQGVRLPRDTLAMAQQLPEVSAGQRQPGDLLFFDTEGKPFSHVGLYVGEDAFVHAPGSGRQVMRSSLAQPYWRTRLVGVRRPR